MQSIYQFHNVQTESQNPWIHTELSHSLDGQVTVEPEHVTSHLKLFNSFTRTPIVSGATITGIELYVRFGMERDNPIVPDQTVHSFDISTANATWYDTGIDLTNGQDCTVICTWDTQPKSGLNYLYPEGSYAGGASGHFYDPDKCLNTSGAYYAASNCRSESMVAQVVPYGTQACTDATQVAYPPINPGDDVITIFSVTSTTGIQLNRSSTFTSSGGRLLLCFNDKVANGYGGLGDYANNTGSFHVKVIVGNGSHSRIDIGLSISEGYDFTENYFETVEVGGIDIKVLGSPTSKWGRNSWSSEDIQTTVGIVSRRSIMEGECTSDRRTIDVAWIVVYWNPPGGLFDMAERTSTKQRVLFAKETTHGTTVACTRRAMSWKVDPKIQGTFKSFRPQGNKLEQLHMLTKEWATSAVSGVPTYDEMGFLLASCIGTPASSGNAQDAWNEHQFVFDNREEQDASTYTVEYGSPDSRAHRVSYGFFDGLGIDFTREDASLNGSFMARRIVDGVTMSAGVNCVQTLTFTGTPTGGTFKLSFKGAITAAITYTQTAATLASNIQTALNALSTIGASGVSVAANSGSPIITFSGSALAGMALPLVEFVTHNGANALSDGTSPSASVAMTTVGGFLEDPMVPILPGHVSVYLSDTYSTLSSNQLTRAKLAKFDISNRFDPMWVLNASENSFLKAIESQPKIKFDLQLQADSNGMALLDTARSGARKFIRIEAVGPEIASTGYYHTLTIDSAVKVEAFGELGDSDGVYQVNYSLGGVEDKSWGNSTIITLQNGKPGY